MTSLKISTADLIHKVRERNLELTRKEANTAVRSLLEIVAEELVKGNEVRLEGIGALKTRRKGPSKRRNPRTNETFTQPPRSVPVARFFKGFREDIKASGEISQED